MKYIVKGVVGLFLIVSLVVYASINIFRMIEENIELSTGLLDYKGTIEFVQTMEGQQLLILTCIAVLSGTFVGSKIQWKDKTFDDASKLGLHGTARFALASEFYKKKAIWKNSSYSRYILKSFRRMKRGIILGIIPNTKKLMVLPKTSEIPNRNVLVTGSSGAGKGFAFVINNIVNNTEETIIATDPKGELYNITKEVKKLQGYKVYQIDFKDLVGARYNPLDFVNTQLQAKKLGDTIAKNAQKDGKEDFFASSARDIITGFIIFALEEYKINRKDNPNLRRPSLSKEVKSYISQYANSEKYAKALLLGMDENHPAYTYIDDATNLKGKTKDSVIATANQQLAIFSIKEVADMTDTSDFTFQDLQDEKSVLYIKIPMNDNPVAPLTSTFISQMIDNFYEIADKNPNDRGEPHLPIDSVFILDEFANIGKVETYTNTLSTCRGLGMSMNTIIQGHDQLEDLYGKETSRTIINNHAINLFLKTDDTETAKYYSERAGQTTTRIETKSKNKSGGLFDFKSTGGGSTSEQYNSRDLITQGELMNIEKDDCYVFVSGFHPFKLNKAWHTKVFGNLLKKLDKVHHRFKRLSNPDAYKFLDRYMHSRFPTFVMNLDKVRAYFDAPVLVTDGEQTGFTKEKLETTQEAKENDLSSTSNTPPPASAPEPQTPQGVKEVSPEEWKTSTIYRAMLKGFVEKKAKNEPLLDREVSPQIINEQLLNQYFDYESEHKDATEAQMEQDLEGYPETELNEEVKRATVESQFHWNEVQEAIKVRDFAGLDAYEAYEDKVDDELYELTQNQE